MNKINKTYSILILFLIIVGLGLVKFSTITGELDEDNVKREWPGKSETYLATNIEKATGDIEIQISKIDSYISNCKRFPANLLDAYQPIQSPPKYCRPLKPKHRNVVTPWIDPWGRGYQIRYNKDRMKIQMRTLGRNEFDSKDDIVRETNLSIYKDVLDAEIAKCSSMAPGDKGCAFNRDWH